MKIGIHAGGKDMDEVIRYCKDLGVGYVCLSCSSIEGYDARGVPDLDHLKDVKSHLAEAGVGVPTMHLNRRPSPQALLDQPEGKEEVENLCRTIECLGGASIWSMLWYIELEKPKSEEEERACWQGLFRFFRRIVDQAERSQVRLASHARYIPQKFLVRSYKELGRLVEAVPSPYNGVTYCPGAHISGDNVQEVVDRFKGKIFFVQARDVRGRGEGAEEVRLGEGDVGLPRILQLLHEFGYDGIICPEHLPVREQGEDPQATAVEYLKRELSALANPH